MLVRMWSQLETGFGSLKSVSGSSTNVQGTVWEGAVLRAGGCQPYRPSLTANGGGALASNGGLGWAPPASTTRSSPGV